MIYRAYAKINLGLRIIGRRTDGYHNLESIFYRIGLFDELSLVKTDGKISLSCSNPAIPCNEENLCWKAALLLQKKLDVTLGADISLKKNIPVGGGLGGGSSDAAVVLRYLPTLWNVETEVEEIKLLALELGSDVPYFLFDSTSYGEGRGEQLTKLQLHVPYWIVLVYPNFHIATPWAYKTLSEKRMGKFPIRPSLIDDIALGDWKKILVNDFEEIVFAHHPELEDIKLKLLDFGASFSAMSGSGSSMFGLFSRENDARAALEYFSQTSFAHLTEPNFIPT